MLQLAPGHKGGTDKSFAGDDSRKRNVVSFNQLEGL